MYVAYQDFTQIKVLSKELMRENRDVESRAREKYQNIKSEAKEKEQRRYVKSTATE